MPERLSPQQLSEDMIKSLLQLIEDEIKEPSHRKKRGRPKAYSESFILLVFFIKTTMGLSFRKTVSYLEETLNVKMPSISVLHYRFSKLDISRFQKLFEKLAKKLGVQNGKMPDFPTPADINIKLPDSNKAQ